MKVTVMSRNKPQARVRDKCIDTIARTTDRQIAGC
jgi:hypothetical protein